MSDMTSVYIPATTSLPTVLNQAAVLANGLGIVSAPLSIRNTDTHRVVVMPTPVAHALAAHRPDLVLVPPVPVAPVVEPRAALGHGQRRLDPQPARAVPAAATPAPAPVPEPVVETPTRHRQTVAASPPETTDVAAEPVTEPSPEAPDEPVVDDAPKKTNTRKKTKTKKPAARKRTHEGDS